MPTRSAATRPHDAVKTSGAVANVAGKARRVVASEAGKARRATARAAATGTKAAATVASPRIEKPHARVSTPRATHPQTARVSARERETRRREQEASRREQRTTRRERHEARTASRPSFVEAVGNVAAFFAESRGRQILGIAVLAIALLVVALYGPAKSYYTAVRERDDLTTYYARLEASNSSLRDSIQYLQSTEGIEDEARKRGYVYEGETSAQIDGLEDTTDDFTGTSEVPDVEQPWYVQALDRFFGYQSPAY